MRRPTHAQVRQAVTPRAELARAIRPYVEPLLAAGYTWSEIGQAVERHLHQGRTEGEPPLGGGAKLHGHG